MNTTRLKAPDYQERPGRPMYMQDMDRITFSAPFRRLANKTQVHPLYDNDHIHHRLIHSIEVSSVGRSLGIEVGQWLCDEGRITEAQRDKIAGIIQAACLAHDIGNPPFGHSGEAAIGNWFAEQFAQPAGILKALDPAYHQEFKAFEGNAQGFRIVARTEMYANDGGMRLSLGVLGAFTKYPATANVCQARPAAYCGLKKYGLFDNDADLFAQAAEALGLPAENSVKGRWWRRHPLVFLMEAADDICYNIMDMEDAFVSGDVSFAQASESLASLFARRNKATSQRSQFSEISVLRAQAITGAINACVEAFKQHYDALMDGSFSQSLIEVSDKAAEFAAIKDIARDRIFNAPRKTELEVFGRNVIYRVMNGLMPVLDDLAQAGWDPARLSPYHQQLVRACHLDLADATNPYDAVHALTDFVSGMTDRYAVKVADMLGGR
ncbi:MAG: dNTP triphosphohydrolase [Asticcacaulis sp.]